MKLLRLLFLMSIVLLMTAPSAFAQNPGPEFWRRASCEPVFPRTRLEELEQKYSTVLYKGFSRITTVEIRGVRIDAIELRTTTSSQRVKGVVVAIRDSGSSGGERDHNRAFIDYQELTPLISALAEVETVDETTTKLANFEAKYRTNGDLEVTVFRQTRNLTAVTLTTGVCNQATQTLTLDELQKFRAMITEAKARLDDLK
jgi:hypothetical protein